MISNNGHDENNKYHDGVAGDQTGTEWTICNWYDSGWKCVLRHPDANIREMIASHAEKAAKNDNCGYDMYERYTYEKCLIEAKEDPAKIAKKCESDCSSGVTANVRSIGRILKNDALMNIPYNLTTHGMRAAFKKAGFEVLTASKYLKSDNYLLRGDIILNDDKHVTTNLTVGSKVKIQNDLISPAKSISELAAEVIEGKWGNDPERTKKLTAAGYDAKAVQAEVNSRLKITPKVPEQKSYKYRVKVNSYLRIRAGKGTEFPEIGKLYNGQLIDVLYIEGKWAKLAGDGFVYTDWIERV